MAMAALADFDAQSVYDELVEVSRRFRAECDLGQHAHLFEPAPESEYTLPVEPYEEPPRKDTSRVEFVMKHLEQMGLAEMKVELRSIHLDSNGTKKVLKKRLKQYYRKEYVLLKNSGPNRNKTERFFDYFIVIDFECTCEAEIFDYEHEIIEFPAILVDVRRRAIVDTFRTYVRPVLKPKLSDFCSTLTGISQSMVDHAPPFVEAFGLFRHWQAKHHLDPDAKPGMPGSFAYVTDGPWDLAKFFQMQCLQSGFEKIPHDFRSFINVRKAFIMRYCRGCPLQRINLGSMLKDLDMIFEGREHCGLDDATNIARIVVRMLHDRAELRVNEKLVHERHLLSWQKNQMPPTESLKDDERQKWRDTLPYKMVQISRDRFITYEYLECESCPSSDENTD
ncbi:exonuclease [Aphelenchoides avenae]|nr:exonuclease [Aphelenchus avenae]